MTKTNIRGGQIADGANGVDLTVDVTGTLPVANGGTGGASQTLNNVLLGNGTGALQNVAPGTTGNVLRSDGTTFASTALVTGDLPQAQSGKTLDDTFMGEVFDAHKTQRPVTLLASNDFVAMDSLEIRAADSVEVPSTSSLEVMYCVTRKDVTTAIAAATPTFNVDNYGADPTGVAFSDTAVDAAVAAMGTSPGVVMFGKGTYKLNTTKTFALPGQSPSGAGSGLTTIDYRGTGDCFRVYDSTANPAVYPANGQAGPIVGLKIIGQFNANSNTCGLHIGDLYGIYINDVWIRYFDNSGSRGFWGENLNTWAEKAYIRMRVDDCTDQYIFETNASHPNGWSSWDYNTFDLSFIAPVNTNGITLKKDVYMDGVDMVVFGNCGLGASNTGVALTVGTTGTDTAYIRGRLQFQAETNGVGAVGPKDVNVGAVAKIKGYGALEFISATFTAGTAAAATVDFFGRVNCPSLGTMAAGTCLRTVGTPVLTGPVIDKVKAANTWSVLEFYDNIGGGGGGNWALFQNAAAGSAPKLQVDGTDTNVNLNLVTKGSGLATANDLPLNAERFVTLTSAYTLTSQTAAQKLFNASTNGAVTLPIGSYFFECFYSLSAMSATSGAFGFALGGAATIAAQLWRAEASKAVLATITTAVSNTVNTAANTALVAANTTTVGWAKITGKIRVSVAGTVIPQVSLGVAAAAVVGVDSYFRIWQVGLNTVTTAGTWT